MKFSLVIPVAPDRGAEILRSVRNLDYPMSSYQVIVVKGKNPSENRNKGAETAKGDIIAFLDDDAKLPKDYLIKAKEFFDDHHSIDAVGGPQLTPEDDGLFAKISGYALASRFGAWDRSNRYFQDKLNLDAHEKDITSANLLCRRKVIENVKFHPKFFPGEDPRFIIDAKRKGYRVAYSPDIIVYHRRRRNLDQLMKQIFNYGKVRTRIDSFLNTLKSPIFFIPSIFSLYVLSLFLLFSLVPFIGLYKGAVGLIDPVLLLYPLFLYFIIALSFSIYEGVKNNCIVTVLSLPFIYLMIHVSYGAGLMYGYFDVIRRTLD